MSARPPTSAMATDNKPKAVEIPEIVVDPNSKRRYERGRFLGKVRSSRCLTLLLYLSICWVLLKCLWAKFRIIHFLNIDFSLDCLIDTWHQGGFAKCYELKDLATGEVRNFQILETSSILTKNWSCSCESKGRLSRWRRERLCPSRSWPRAIKRRKCLRRSGLLKELLKRDSTLCSPGFIRGCRTRTWWSSSATSRTPTLCTLCWSFAGIVFASLLVVHLPHILG